MLWYLAAYSKFAVCDTFKYMKRQIKKRNISIVYKYVHKPLTRKESNPTVKITGLTKDNAAQYKRKLRRKHEHH